MPVDCGLLSASPPMFAFSLGSYQSRMPYPPNHTLTNGFDFDNGLNGLKVPSRSCLCPHTVKPKNGYVRKSQKRVQFADDKGYALYTIRVMSEPSDCPPKLQEDVLASVIADANAAARSTAPWELNFKQPAADYLEYRRRLQTNSVSLENVILKEYQLTGTIKVKNLSFHKKVGARVTFDGWESFVDIPATYVNDGSSGKSTFDTFSFIVYIPPETGKDSKIEFCVYYRVNNQEFWDSNDGKNYSLIPTDLKHTPADVLDSTKSVNTEAILMNIDSWSEFAVWNKTNDSSPYW